MTLLQNNFPTFLQGFGYTLLSSIIALIISMILGTFFAILQILPQKWAQKLVMYMCKYFVTFHY